MTKISAVESDVSTADSYGRLTRLYRYLRDNGPTRRDRLMHFTGFPSPKEQPISAYVEFENEIMRLDRVLRRHGRWIIGVDDRTEIYSLAGEGA